MCDCIKSVEQKLKEAGFKDASIHVSFSGFMAGKLEEKPAGLTFEYQEMKSDGTPKLKKTTGNLSPAYCPFCGKKYDEEKA